MDPVKEALRIEKRVLPREDWDHAPTHVRALVEDAPDNRRLAYDMIYGWCVVEPASADQAPKLIYMERAPGPEGP